MAKRDLAHRCVASQSFVIVFFEVDQGHNIVLVVRICGRINTHGKVLQTATLVQLWTVVRREVFLQALVDHADLLQALRLLLPGAGIVSFAIDPIRVLADNHGLRH